MPERTFKIKWKEDFWAFGGETLTKIIDKHYRAIDKVLQSPPEFSVEEMPLRGDCLEAMKDMPGTDALGDEIDPTGHTVDGLYMNVILTVNRILNYLKKRDKL